MIVFYLVRKHMECTIAFKHLYVFCETKYKFAFCTIKHDPGRIAELNSNGETLTSDRKDQFTLATRLHI